MKKYSIYSLFVCFATLAISNSISAQVDPSYRQYRFNALVLNPAHAGSNEYSDVSVLGSQYWVGMPGAPQTATISGNFKVMDNFGIGATVVADENGPVHSTNVSLVGAYHLKLSNKLRRLWSLYQQNVDLIQVGAYENGSNPELDEAIRLNDRIVNFLRQDMHISQDYEATRSQLRDLLNQP